jgi:hypothetical protein
LSAHSKFVALRQALRETFSAKLFIADHAIGTTSLTKIWNKTERLECEVFCHNSLDRYRSLQYPPSFLNTLNYSVTQVS